ncbi:MAG: hypothetical protein ACI8ZM_004711 [Crocinitomix sp.]|jgi:hypothetical protein
MKITTEIKIEKNPNEAWKVMGYQFAQIDKWASFFNSSEPSGENKFEGIDFSGRISIVETGENTHSLDVFDSENYVLSYTVTAGAPPFSNRTEAKWSLESSDENSCIASIEVNLDIKDEIPSEKIQEVSMWLNKSSSDMLEELKYYVETGEVHSRKKQVSIDNKIA